MNYKAPYTYFINKPNAGSRNLLWGSLALISTQLIPLVGQIVWFGYQAEVLDELERDPEIQAHPDFDINRFSEYIGRGIWVFLMQLIVGLFTAMLALIGVVPALIAAIQLREPLLILAGYAVMIPMILIGTMFTWPLILHVQLSRGFRFGAAMKFTSSFLKKLWGQLLVTLIVHMLISGVLMIVGLFLLCIGIFPALVVQLMAQEHYMVQLYRIYLAEGGEPIGSAAEDLEYEDESLHRPGPND